MEKTFRRERKAEEQIEAIMHLDYLLNEFYHNIGQQHKIDQQRLKNITLESLEYIAHILPKHIEVLKEAEHHHIRAAGRECFMYIADNTDISPIQTENKFVFAEGFEKKENKDIRPKFGRYIPRVTYSDHYLIEQLMGSTLKSNEPYSKLENRFTQRLYILTNNQKGTIQQLTLIDETGCKGYQSEKSSDFLKQFLSRYNSLHKNEYKSVYHSLLLFINTAKEINRATDRLEAFISVDKQY